MTVSDVFRLPAQPGTGTSRFVPLGGNGFNAPKSMWEVAASLAGDVSGGLNQITVNFDTRFRSIVTLSNIVVTGAAAGIEVTHQMRDSENSGPFARAFSNAIPIGLNSLSLSVWNPPPIMTMDSFDAITANVDGDSMILNLWMYNFDIRVLERAPMWQILANLPRGGLQDNSSPN